MGMVGGLKGPGQEAWVGWGGGVSGSLDWGVLRIVGRDLKESMGWDAGLWRGAQPRGPDPAVQHRPTSPSHRTPQAMVEPPNFSWVAEGRLAGLAMPREPGHYRFLLGRGVRHLVSLSERAPPHHGCCPALQLHRFRVPDFTPPTPGQIQSFLQLVEEANGRGEVRTGG